MKNIILLALSVSILISVQSGCGVKKSPADRVLAKVSDSEITVSEFNSKVDKLPAYYRKLVEQDRGRYLEEMIIEKLFYEAAIRSGLDRDKEVQDVIKEAKKKIIVAKLIESEVEKKVDVGEDEMRRYYEEHKGDFKTPELWRASHILVATEQEAKDALDALAKGAKFEDLARERSMDATSSRGGDLGFFRVGQLVPDFEKEALRLNMGQTSGVVHTQFGYHIIRLTDKREPGAEDFEKAKGKIENELKKRKRAELFEKLVMDLKGKYGVSINEDVLESLGKPGQPEGPEAG